MTKILKSKFKGLSEGKVVLNTEQYLTFTNNLEKSIKGLKIDQYEVIDEYSNTKETLFLLNVSKTDIQKGGEVPIGTVSTWKDGSKHKKTGKDKWEEVSEKHNLTAKEHEERFNFYKQKADKIKNSKFEMPLDKEVIEEHEKEAKKHKELSEKLSKETKKDSDFKIKEASKEPEGNLNDLKNQEIDFVEVDGDIADYSGANKVDEMYINIKGYGLTESQINSLGKLKDSLKVLSLSKHFDENGDTFKKIKEVLPNTEIKNDSKTAVPTKKDEPKKTEVRKETKEDKSEGNEDLKSFGKHMIINSVINNNPRHEKEYAMKRLEKDVLRAKEDIDGYKRRQSKNSKPEIFNEVIAKNEEWLKQLKSEISSGGKGVDKILKDPKYKDGFYSE